MAEYKTILKTNTNYEANMTSDGIVAVSMRASISSSNPGNYNMTKTVNNESVYETNKAGLDEQCDAFEEMVKAAADTENDENSMAVISVNDQSQHEENDPEPEV